jgi:DNA polymerase I-like protein with 3'-5' exonuclease and polymerase domains
MVRQVAHSTPAKLLQVLESSVELQSSSPLRRLSSMMWIEAHKRSMTLTEISEHLVQEARTIIEKDIGPVDWEAGEKVGSSQSAFKTPVKGKKVAKKKIRQVTPKRALPLHTICESIKDKVPSAPIGRNSLYEDENLSTRPEDIPVTPVPGPSRAGSDVSPVKSVFSSEASQNTSPTTSSSSSCVPKVLFSHGGESVRKRPAAAPLTPTCDVATKRKCPQDTKSLPVIDFKHNVTPARVTRVDVSTESDMRKLMDSWKEKKFAGFDWIEQKCEADIPIIGSRKSEQRKSGEVHDGIVFQDEMRVLTRISICLGDNESFSISGRSALTLFGPILKETMTSDMSITAFDVKHAYRILKECFGLDRQSLLSMEWFDLKTCYWLSDPETREPVSALTLVSYYPDLEAFVPFVKQLKTSISFRSAIVFPLRECMQKNILNQHNFDHIFRTIEVPVALLMAEAESRGIGVDRSYMSHLSKEASSVKKSLEERARKVAGVSKLNMASIPQLKQIMYKNLNLLSLLDEVDKNEWRTKRAKETKGAPEHLTTGKRTLMTLSKYHQFPALVIEYRKIQSARTKTISHVEEYLSDYTTNRIYSNFTTFSATGRIHMGEPDLQKTQNTFSVKFFTPDGKEENREINVRKVFVPSEGYHYVSADYRQLELRILAYLCQDQVLVQVLDSGGDVFTELAAQLNDKFSEDVTYEERQHAKTLVYGVIYGMGQFQLSLQLEVSEEEAKSFRDNFHNTYPGIQVFIKSLEEKASEQGFAETLLGRRRMLSCARSGNSDDKARALRQAVNTTIQGSAADLVKLAMIHLDRAIYEQSISAFLVHEMHDELIYEVKEDHVQTFTRLINETMRNVAKKEFPQTFAVPLPVKVRTGANWGELVDVEFDD